MSDNKHNKDPFFTNEATLLRRAWIEAAVNGVRARIDAGPDADSPIPVAASEPRTLSIVQPADAAALPLMEAKRRRPNLYVAWPVQERRSGT
jgi:hypothetical protein